MARLKTVKPRLNCYKTNIVQVQAKRKTGSFLVKRREEHYLKANGICNQCKLVVSFNDYELDHIIPLSLGGFDSDSNLQVLCKECHKKKTEGERSKA